MGKPNRKPQSLTPEAQKKTLKKITSILQKKKFGGKKTVKICLRVSSHTEVLGTPKKIGGKFWCNSKPDTPRCSKKRGF